MALPYECSERGVRLKPAASFPEVRLVLHSKTRAVFQLRKETNRSEYDISSVFLLLTEA